MRKLKLSKEKVGQISLKFNTKATDPAFKRLTLQRRHERSRSQSPSHPSPRKLFTKEEAKHSGIRLMNFTSYRSKESLEKNKISKE